MAENKKRKKAINTQRKPNHDDHPRPEDCCSQITRKVTKGNATENRKMRK